MLSQFKMNPDPAYQNRLLPERDNASFFDGYSVWFYKEQGDLQQANAFTLEFEIAPFGISSEGDAIFSCMDRKTSEGMAVRLTSDGKVEVILGFGGRQMVFYSIRENVDLEKWNHIFVIYRFHEGWCDLVVNGVLSNRLQFGRFQKIKWPRHQIFIGKDADKDCLTPQMGVFWGWMKNIQFLSEAVSVEQAIKDSKRENSLEKVLYTPNRTRFLNDANRPQYHLIEPEKWMNEPHAPDRKSVV